MYSHRIFKARSITVLVTCLATCAFGVAQQSPRDAYDREKGAPQSLPPLGLPRFADAPGSPDKPTLARADFEILDFTSLTSNTSAHVRDSIKTRTKFLDIAANARWERPLRSARKRVSFVTITLHASIGTVIDVRGASIAVLPSKQEGFADLIVGASKTSLDNWQALPTPLPLRNFEGRKMITVVAATIAVDSSSNEWALYSGYRLVAQDLPLSRGASNLGITCGESGSWLCGLAISDENPVFADDNANLVPDDFERRSLGKLLPPAESKQIIATLRSQWKQEQGANRPPRLNVSIPPPDPVLNTGNVE